MQQYADKLGSEKLVRIAFGCAALQGFQFCDEVVANALWRSGIKLAEHYSGSNGHVGKVVSLFDQKLNKSFTDAQLVNDKHFREFKSVLLRHHAKSDIPSEYRKPLREFTATAMEQILVTDFSQRAWLTIQLYQEAGQFDRARDLYERFTVLPSAEAQRWELQRLSNKVRAFSNEAAWASWAIDVCDRLENNFAVEKEVTQLLVELFDAAVKAEGQRLKWRKTKAKEISLNIGG